jgi:hypothetical protein
MYLALINIASQGSLFIELYLYKFILLTVYHCSNMITFNSFDNEYMYDHNF